MTEQSTVVSTRLMAADSDAVAEAARLLAAGSLVAFPTETVYGLGADATSSTAVRRVFEAKGRPFGDPLIVHVQGSSQAEELGDLSVGSGAARRLAEEFWPGPLTVVVPRRGGLADEVAAGRDTVALRCPAHPVALDLIQSAGVPVAAPSANRFGRISPTCAEDVLEELGGRVDVVLDDGPTPLGVESTVVAFDAIAPRILRPGGLTVEDLLAVVPDLVTSETVIDLGDESMASPGTLLGHYAPRVPLTLVEGDGNLIEQLRDALSLAGAIVEVVLLPRDPKAAARDLYGALRALDRGRPQLALVAARAPGGLGRTVNDRLFRAAHGHVATDTSEATIRRLIRRLRP